MASDFDKETQALTEAVHGRPVNYNDISENLTYVKGETGSANHKMGSNPAWWLDCQRRGDSATVTKGLDWSDWYASTPLHENESMTCNAPYRVRIDQGTYALAMFAHFAGQSALVGRLLKKTRLSVGLSILGAFTGPAKKLVKNNPQPAHVATLLVADGPMNLLAGDTNNQVPHVADSGMRSKVRSGDGHNGPFTNLDDNHLRVLVAQALSLPHKKVGNQSDIFDTIRSRTGLAPWGLSTADVEVGKACLRNKLDVAAAQKVFQWLLSAPLPKNPYVYIQRASGAIEVVQVHTKSSSTGAIQAVVVAADGTRYIGSADNGMRGGSNSSQNIQEQETIEAPDKWTCRWVSGEGEVVEVPRPSQSDAVLWRMDMANGAATFRSGGWPDPTPPDPPQPQPPMPGSPLVYLGKTGVPGEYLYGSHNPNLIVREIHGDPASGFPKRWIAE